MLHPLLVPTPDGSDQAVHPDVIDTVAGFAGHRYWMACTPYPFSDDRQENPLVRVSDDGLRWSPVPGAPDPLVAPPDDSRRHWSDTDLVLVDGELHLVFRGCERGQPHAELLTTRSRDGVMWTPPEVFWAGDRAVSPAVVVDGATWMMWHIEADSVPQGRPATLVRHEGPSLTSLSGRTECHLSVPGHVLWHLDVVATDRGFEALVAAYPVSRNASRCRLFHAVSADGVHFELSTSKPVLAPSLRSWCSRVIYRSSFQKEGDGTYRVWYTGGSWGKRWGIGLAVGEIANLATVPGSGPWPATPQGWFENLTGLADYVVQYRLPTPVRAILRRGRVLMQRRPTAS